MFSKEERQEIQLFLALLYPWDDDGSKLYKSISWTFPDKDGEMQMANYTAQSMDDLMRLITTRAKRPGANVYACLGTQKMASTEKYATDGFAKAIRQHKNIVSFRAIALDIDVGKPGAYATTDDAFDDLDAFCSASGMPTPTMEVYSGTGGLHVYWCFDRDIPQENWAPLARGLQVAALNYGLKFDPQVTVNPAGILRVPNTWNHKLSPPRKTFLYREEGHTFPRYSYQQLVSVLGVSMGTQKQLPAQGNKANAQRSSNFSAGIEEAAPPPVTIEELAINCDVINDILEREGDGDAEPLWNLALYAAAFTKDPHDAAHKLSKGDARYSSAETEKKLDEKISARASNKEAGWPTCEKFSALHPACATCPFFMLNKTPFHHVPNASSQANDSPETKFIAASDDVLMPPGYWRNKRHHIYTLLQTKQGESYAAEIVNYPILDAGIDSDTGALLYEAAIGGVPRWREIDVGANLQPLAMAGALAKGYGLHVDPKHHTAVRNFLVAWIGHLQTAQRHKKQGAYGWQTGGSFAFDEKLFLADRTESVFRGKRHDENFRSVGDLKPWQDAMQLVYGNMPLELVVASAFAAPLVELIGTSSLVISLYSALSGIGKTTSMMLGQSVWGHPRAGMSTLADTTNSTMKKLSDLKSLPVYWDELRTRDQLDKVIDIVFQVTQGKGKARLNKDATQQEAKTFTTMFAVASNYGIADNVYSKTESTEAGGLRIFEIEAQPLRTSLSDSHARRLMLPLQENYGVAGAHYAEFLARNRGLVKAMLQRVDEHLGHEFDLVPKERFWWMTMTTLLVGAQLANHCGIANFSIAGLREYVGRQLAEQRNEMVAQESSTMQATSNIVSLIKEMLADLRGKHLIITETIPYHAGGRPVVVNLVETDLSRLQNIWAQVGHKDGRLRLKARSFKDWVRKQHLNPKQVLIALRSDYVVTQSKQTIGAGVPGLDALATFGRYECYDLTPLPRPSASPAPSPGSDGPTSPPD